MIREIKNYFESYKIKKIIKAYDYLKKENPDIPEHKLCYRLVADRLYITRKTNNTGIRTIEDADYLVKGTLRGTISNIEKTCAWIIIRESKGGTVSSIEKIGNKNYMDEFQENIEEEKRLIEKIKKIKRKMNIK